MINWLSSYFALQWKNPCLRTKMGGVQNSVSKGGEGGDGLGGQHSGKDYI